VLARRRSPAGSLKPDKKMDTISLRLSLFLGVHAGIVLGVLLLA
jgi:hypothetical protein